MDTIVLSQLIQGGGGGGGGEGGGGGLGNTIKPPGMKSPVKRGGG